LFLRNGDTRTFSNLKSTYCTLLILLIINLETKIVCVSKVQREQNGSEIWGSFNTQTAKFKNDRQITLDHIFNNLMCEKLRIKFGKFNRGDNI
jgi:hypothetical protein